MPGKPGNSPKTCTRKGTVVVREAVRFGRFAGDVFGSMQPRSMPSRAYCKRAARGGDLAGEISEIS